MILGALNSFLLTSYVLDNLMISNPGRLSMIRKKDRVQLQLEWYGMQEMDDSAKRIYEAALGTPEDHLVILLAHNGPAGLGSELNDICGKDWVFEGGDHGDPVISLYGVLSKIIRKYDPEFRISSTSYLPLETDATFSIPLVMFGIMHKELAHGNGLCKMIVVGTDDIIYLNGAIVPRVKPINEASLQAFQFRWNATFILTGKELLM
ncbi:hypothetical protein F3Y22_tig00013738pilonHSYRG00091 [Hibiscus syriacus]|uniref:Uncharacterized protein n=1 Tax=Hibiscus syriacus TaxID=106335 RepID=A0A6A3C6Q9_HIBSY|nr:hypothetical protein F3Y22_tig00013738pilonHSYRG00091 [Hibiscus syriacus]